MTLAKSDLIALIKSGYLGGTLGALKLYIPNDPTVDKAIEANDSLQETLIDNVLMRLEESKDNGTNQ